MAGTVIEPPMRFEFFMLWKFPPLFLGCFYTLKLLEGLHLRKQKLCGELRQQCPQVEPRFRLGSRLQAAK